MIGKNVIRPCLALAVTAVLTVSSAFISEASAVKEETPLTLHMDINNRQTAIYDGYSSYVMGYRASEYDTFTVTTDSNDIDLDDVVMNYYLITYDGDTQKYLECTVYGLKEGTHYPVVRPETAAKESETGNFYDYLERCYVIEFCYKDMRKSSYFTLLPEEDMSNYRNILLGKWDKDAKGWKYVYQEKMLTSWAEINDNWYYFGSNGYMQTGWLEYKGNWYYLDTATGAMKKSCFVDGYELNGDGVRI
jgi:hypothetical protein